MGIVSSSVLSDTAQVDGRRSIRLEWVAHTGETVERGGLYPVGFDAAAALVSGVDDALKALSGWEYDRVLSSIISGSSVPSVLASLEHSTTPSILKGLLLALMRTNDPRVVISLKPVALYVNSTYTDAQIRAALGISQAKLDAYKARLRSVITDTGATMEDHIAAMDSTLEQWGDN